MQDEYPQLPLFAVGRYLQAGMEVMLLPFFTFSVSCEH